MTSAPGKDLSYNNATTLMCDNLCAKEPEIEDPLVSWEHVVAVALAVELVGIDVT